MMCPEKLRLQQLYEASVRRWALRATTQWFGEATYLTEEVRRRALAERNAAKTRLTMHKQHCKICRRKL
jgi:hypothetical protein